MCVVSTVSSLFTLRDWKRGGQVGHNVLLRVNVGRVFLLLALCSDDIAARLFAHCPPARWPAGPPAGEYCAGIRSAIQSLERVRHGVAQLSDHVHGGILGSGGAHTAATGGSGKRRRRRRPYSPFLAQPFVKVEEGVFK